MRIFWMLFAALALAVTGCEEGEAEAGEEPVETDTPPTEALEAAEAEVEAEAEEAEEEMEVEEPIALNCEIFVDKLVELMGEEEGSFINAGNRDDWVLGCRQKGDIAEHREVATCIVRADTIEESQECGDTGFINRWVMR